MRKVIYTDNCLDNAVLAKAAYSLLRYCENEIAYILDEKFYNRNVVEVTGINVLNNIPIISSLDELEEGVYELVLGFSPVGGRLSDKQRLVVKKALDRKFKIINGLHDILEGPIELIENLRMFNDSMKIVAKDFKYRSKIVLPVGTDFSVGKMTTTIEMNRALNMNNIKSTWIATGQTGMMIQNEGLALDSIPADFFTGNLEKLVIDKDDDYEVIIVEGQGSHNHCSYSIGPIGFFHTLKPNYLVICHRMGQEKSSGFDINLPTVSETISFYEGLGKLLNINFEILGVSIDSSRHSHDDFTEYRIMLEKEIGYPVFDPVKEVPESVIEKFRKSKLTYKDNLMEG